MAGYYGGQIVKEGFYLNRSTLEFEPIARWSGILPGDKNTRYSRLPLPAVIVAAPLMGLAYVILLPIVCCFAFIYFFIRWVAHKLKLQSGRTAV